MDGVFGTLPKYITHAVLTCKKVKLIIKRIYQALETFMEAIKIPLKFKVTITDFNFFTDFCFQKFDQDLNKNG